MPSTKVTSDQIRGVLSGTTISSNTSASAVCDSLYVEQGNPIVVATGATLTIDVPFDAGIYKVFDCQGTGKVVFSKGHIRTAYTTWWGLAEAATDAVNAAALKAAIDSNAPIVETPAGNFDYDGTGLIFNRAIRFDGAGGVGEASPTGADGVTPALTKFTYTGTGVGMTLAGTIADSTENIHLSNFLLHGNALAEGGISVGGNNYPTEMVTKGSIKNVKVSFFNRPEGGDTGGYGFRFRAALEFLFENCYANFNFIGWRSFVGDVATTLMIIDSYSRENDSDGVNLQGTFTGCNSISFVAETNGGTGLYIDYIDVSYCNFINWWSENNCTATGTAPISIGGAASTTPYGINFIGGSIGDPVAGVGVNLIGGYGITFTNIAMPGAVAVGAGNVSNCRIEGPFGSSGSVTGNRIGAVRVNGLWEESLATNAITSMVLPVTQGSVHISTLDNNAWYSIFTVSSISGNVVEQLDTGNHFQTTAPADNAGVIGLYHNGSGGFLIKNATTGTVIVQVRQ